jgi:hypothetical protein
MWRTEKGCAQTASADFILGMLIFDTSAVVASNDFVPFMRAPELIPLITYWHFSIGFTSCLVWWCITRWGEPILAAYYQAPRNIIARRQFPIISFAICWMSVFVLVALHIGFFVVKGGSPHV